MEFATLRAARDSGSSRRYPDWLASERRRRLISTEVPRTGRASMRTITNHYIDGAFVESLGVEVIDSVNPRNGELIARAALSDEEDARRAIAAAKRAFESFRRTTKEERADILRRLHEVVAARIDDLIAAMVEEYGGTVQLSTLIVKSDPESLLQAEKALQELPLVRTWNKTTVYLEPVRVAGLTTAWNAKALFVCAKLASAIAAGCTAVEHGRSITAQIQRILIDRPGWFPNVETIATQLSMTPRMLHRRLEAEQTTYRQVVSKVRMSLAIQYLGKTRMTNEEIAAQLGYSDAANFRHAFIRWTGKRPSDYRRYERRPIAAPAVCREITRK
jgi:AraC-like DNA-binding protein